MLGKRLGAGAFGVVHKATAIGIIPDEEETTVAVKMVKEKTDNNVIRALVSELKIMIHLGRHLNVVNVLGAVTKNIAKRELMVIVEYCRFGSLQDFLVKTRNDFIDQVRDGVIDLCVNEKQKTRDQIGYVDLSFIDSDIQNYTRFNQFEPDKNQESASSEAEAKKICTSDLLCWAFQIAQGMNYLSSRKILHGDLAARNILLCDNNVVKICDFGLAKNLYKAQNYTKKSETPLPFKWLALESIADRTFSVYSDVWSFGVLMWELFTLGSVPYPEMEAGKSLFHKIRDGHRLEMPEYCTTSIYDIMMSCWLKVPNMRPLFSELEDKIGSLLSDDMKNDIINLNMPYEKANNDLFKNYPDILFRFNESTDTSNPSAAWSHENERLIVNETPIE